MRLLAMFLGAFLGLSALNVQAETGIVRSIITTAIEAMEPVSDLAQVSTDVTRVYYFTELQGFRGHAITHRWEYNGKLMAEVSFQVNSDRWRTWSSKNMLPSWAGTWQVSVLDEGGNLMEQKQFEYVKAGSKPSTASAQPGNR